MKKILLILIVAIVVVLSMGSTYAFAEEVTPAEVVIVDPLETQFSNIVEELTPIISLLGVIVTAVISIVGIIKKTTKPIKTLINGVSERVKAVETKEIIAKVDSELIKGLIRSQESTRANLQLESKQITLLAKVLKLMAQSTIGNPSIANEAVGMLNCIIGQDKPMTEQNSDLRALEQKAYITIEEPKEVIEPIQEPIIESKEDYFRR